MEKGLNDDDDDDNVNPILIFSRKNLCQYCAVQQEIESSQLCSRFVTRKLADLDRNQPTIGSAKTSRIEHNTGQFTTG